MDSGRLNGASHDDNEGKKQKKSPHWDFDYWPPNMGNHLIGGCLRGGSTVVYLV